MHSGNYKRAKPEYRGNWGSVRKKILKRDNHECQIGLPGCTLTATTVDHIIPLAWGGDPRDPSNLRAACSHCNLELSHIAKKHKPRKTSTRPTGDPSTPAVTSNLPSREW